MSFMRGEIYEVEVNGGVKNALVVSCDARKDDKYISIVMMNKMAYGSDPVPIKARDMEYADCDRVSFLQQDRIGMFVRTASEEEMKHIDKAIIATLDLKVDSDSFGSLETEDLKRKCKDLQSKNDDLTMQLEGSERQLEEAETHIRHLEEDIEESKCDALTPAKVDASAEFTRIQVERDFYKEQYEKIFNMIVLR